MDAFDLSELQLYVPQLDLQLLRFGLVGCVVKNNFGVGNSFLLSDHVILVSSFSAAKNPDLVQMVSFMCPVSTDRVAVAWEEWSMLGCQTMKFDIDHDQQQRGRICSPTRFRYHDYVIHAFSKNEHLKSHVFRYTSISWDRAKTYPRQSQEGMVSRSLMWVGVPSNDRVSEAMLTSNRRCVSESMTWRLASLDIGALGVGLQ